MPVKAAFAVSGWPEGSLPALLERWIWVNDARMLTWGAIRVEGIVKGPDTVGETGADIGALVDKGNQRMLDGIARAMREQMYRDAESAIEAAQQAGWVLAEHPRIEAGGELNRDRDTGVLVPRTEMRVVLTFTEPG